MKSELYQDSNKIPAAFNTSYQRGVGIKTK